MEDENIERLVPIVEPKPQTWTHIHENGRVYTYRSVGPFIKQEPKRPKTEEDNPFYLPPNF